MRPLGNWRRNTLQLAFIGLVVAGIATSGLAQGSSCTTLGTQSCAPTLGDAGSFTLPTCYARDVVQAGIMTGCGGDRFCPQGVVTRADMAVFLENAKHVGAPYQMLAATGVSADVPASFPLACWIEQFSRDGITAGCGVGTYCPNDALTRAQMAVFILKTKHGAGYVPPACDAAGQPRFNDVACPSTYAAWIGQFAKECITAGCGVGLFCPDASITRQEMSVFLRKAFLVPDACIAVPCT
jgi:hypothetical protein